MVAQQSSNKWKQRQIRLEMTTSDWARPFMAYRRQPGPDPQRSVAPIGVRRPLVYSNRPLPANNGLPYLAIAPVRNIGHLGQQRTGLRALLFQ